MSDPIKDFLEGARGGRYPLAKFDVQNVPVDGIIVGKPKVIDTQDGRALIVDLATSELDHDNGVTLWADTRGGRARALADAVTAAGVDTLAEGGRVQMAWTDSKDTGKQSPFKVYSAVYTPPRAAVSMDSIFGSNTG